MSESALLAVLEEHARREQEIDQLVAILEVRYTFEFETKAGRTRRTEVHEYVSTVTNTPISNAFVRKVKAALKKLGVKPIRAFGHNYYKHIQLRDGASS